MAVGHIKTEKIQGYANLQPLGGARGPKISVFNKIQEVEI